MNFALSQSLLQLDKQLTEESTISINNVELDNYLKQLSQSTDDKTIDKVIALYKETIVKLEQDIWHNHPSEKNIELYQTVFKALEQLYNLKTEDDRYSFKIVIPVADRPQHLKQCLNSLLTLCQSYEYGGVKNRQFTKISVLIADDSRDEKNISLHKSYCTELSNAGIATEYFGLEQQLALVNELSASNAGLAKIISNTDDIKEFTEFSHKGASIMRNITYLQLKKSLHQKNSAQNTLIYFIDSDQEFCINAANSDNNYYAINYFHYLNEIFQTKNVSILTGKVVGDPPVSPAVMAGNFQQDIYNFLSSIENFQPEDACRFHQRQESGRDDAAYHDMASLFGFSNQEKVFNYHCTLQNEHSNADCFRDFSNKLNHFFYGEHPTRKTFFNYEDGFTKTSFARTVYTGNYVIKPDNLIYFIPFATLKLRMAGPVLGRILKNKLQHGFVSANLPMLHNRTVDSTGQSEFRAGVENNNKKIDLGNEFIRQFYGDVMLFAMEEITSSSFPVSSTDKDGIQTILDATYSKIKDNYIEKHNTILQLKSQINQRLNKQGHWWNKASANNQDLTAALTDFDDFLNNIQLNFDDNTDAYLQITSPGLAKKHLDKIFHAIMSYQDDLSGWKKALDSLTANH